MERKVEIENRIVGRRRKRQQWSSAGMDLLEGSLERARESQGREWGGLIRERRERREKKNDARNDESLSRENKF